MGKTVLVIALMLVMVCTVGANEMLTPVDIGTPNTTGESLDGDPYLYPGFSVGSSEPAAAACGACHAVVEFDLSGLNLEEGQLCQAVLRNIRIQEVTTSEDPPGDGYFTVQVYDLADLYEDGTVTSSDYGQATGSPLATLNITPESAGTVFNHIDVTESVRHDLFDAGQTGYSGFILVSADMYNESVNFDDTPILEIMPCAIPSLSKTGVILLILTLACTAYMIMRRRKKTA